MKATSNLKKDTPGTTDAAVASVVVLAVMDGTVEVRAVVVAVLTLGTIGEKGWNGRGPGRGPSWPLAFRTRVFLGSSMIPKSDKNGLSFQ